MATARKTAAAGGPRRLAARSGTAKSAPGARTLVASPGTVTLEEVLIGFQRSLARATRSSFETARADWQVSLGQRALYVIDGIGVSLAAGVVTSVDDAGRVQAVSLDLSPGGVAGGSRIDFRVQARPIEAIAGEQLILADLDPLGLQAPRHAMRLTLIGSHGGDEAVVRSFRAPVALRSLDEPEAVAVAGPPAMSWVPLPGRDLTLYIVGGDTGNAETYTLKTNAVGQVDVEIDALANRIRSGERSHAFAELDLTTRDDDFFVYAACSVEQGLGGISGKLTSNVLQFWVKRMAPAAKTGRKGAR